MISMFRNNCIRTLIYHHVSSCPCFIFILKAIVHFYSTIIKLLLYCHIVYDSLPTSIRVIQQNTTNEHPFSKERLIRFDNYILPL
jgi:hypothetical protein